MKADVSDARRDFLYRDFDAVFRYRIAFSNMRLAALGATLTFFGFLISIGASEEWPQRLGRLMAVELVVFTGIRIVAALNHGIAVFANHISWIEHELGQEGFSTYWRRHLSRHTLDSGNYAFVVATRALNVGALFFVCGGLLPILKRPVVLDAVVIYVIGIGVALLLATWNEIHIRSRLDPRGFSQRLAESLDKARRDSFPIVKSDCGLDDA